MAAGLLFIFYRENTEEKYMSEQNNMKIIARIHNDFQTKFGIPHQSNRLSALKATIVFEPEYRVTEAFRGLEDYDYIWLIWQFSEAVRENWSPTVRPPRLGGNTRMGVFATRSPFRPNSLGLSSVRLEEIEYHSDLGTVLHISGADLMDGTPIYDIKPYLPYVDSHPEAKGGFTDHIEEHILKVEFPEELLQKIPESQREALIEVLANDPRPRYQKNPERVYGIAYGNGSTGKVAFLHRTVPHNHHFVQHLGVFLQRDVHCCLVRYLYFLADIAYKGDYNGSSWFHIQGKVTVNVGNYTIRCTFFQYIGTDNRAHSITDDTRNFLCLLHCLNGIRR